MWPGPDGSARPRGPGTTDFAGVGATDFTAIRLALRVAGCAPSGSDRAACAATATFSRCSPERKMMNAMNAAGPASKMRRFEIRP